MSSGSRTTESRREEALQRENVPRCSGEMTISLLILVETGTTQTFASTVQGAAEELCL